MHILAAAFIFLIYCNICIYLQGFSASEYCRPWCQNWGRPCSSPLTRELPSILYTGLQRFWPFFEKIKRPGPEMRAKLNSQTHYKYVFRCFEPFRGRLTEKFSKSANINIVFKWFRFGYQKTHKFVASLNHANIFFCWNIIFANFEAKLAQNGSKNEKSFFLTIKQNKLYTASKDKIGSPYCTL